MDNSDICPAGRNTIRPGRNMLRPGVTSLFRKKTQFDLNINFFTKKFLEKIFFGDIDIGSVGCLSCAGHHSSMNFGMFMVKEQINESLFESL